MMRDTGGHKGRGLAKTIDWKLVICYLLLILIGWANIYASVHSSEPASIFDFGSRSGKQFVWIITALCIAAIILFVLSPRIYEGLSVPIYLFVLALLIAVIFLGIEVKGSRSWFAFGSIRFQPAEISKISTSLLLATVMSQQGYRIGKAKDFIITALIIIIPMMVIVLQSETGSALVYVGFIFMLYREGLSGWLIFLVGMAILSFILTLTASTYVAVLVIVGVASLCICLYSGRFKWWVIVGIPLITFFAFLPSLLDLWTGSILGEEGLAALAAADGNYEAAGLHQPLPDRIRPLYILLGAVGLSLPAVVFTAYRERNMFSHLAVISMIAGIALVFSADFIFNDVLQDHQRKRIEVLLGMKEDPSGVGYNVNQSKIAIGSGGLFGKGYLNGTQTTYGFVPEQSTDFIFCTIGEEWGFVGTTFVILLYVFLIWRIIRNAERSREAFTRIYGYCVACCIFMHLFINVGMTIGLMPVIGIPLPFISYGGSSLWGFTALLFIFIALDRNEKKYF
ncbi:MAG: rod shape-determining protein RodA [Bacteroidales bacterium]|nr:rod shape-determining protein RodA [Bacteroidales bacterium]